MDLHSLGGRLIVLSILRRNQVHACMEQHGLHRGQLPLLEAIIANPGAPQQDLAAQLLITPASVAQSVKRMCRDGWIEKRTDPENARRNSLYATEAGMRAATACRAEFDRIDAKSFAGLSDDELTTFAALLDRMIDNLRGGRELPSVYPLWKEKTTK